jgi:hypothetical protein
LFEYPDQRHPSTSRITFPIRYPVLSSRSFKTININGLSSEKLILPSPPPFCLQFLDFYRSVSVEEQDLPENYFVCSLEDFNFLDPDFSPDHGAFSWSEEISVLKRESS